MDNNDAVARLDVAQACEGCPLGQATPGGLPERASSLSQAVRTHAPASLIAPSLSCPSHNASGAAPTLNILDPPLERLCVLRI